MSGKRAFLAAAALAAAVAAPGDTGRVLPDLTLALAGGGSALLVDRASAATALVFLRGSHERSDETLRTLAACQPRLAGRPVRIAAVAPADSAADVLASVRASGAALPVLVDAGDAVYAAAGVRTHPAVAIVDRTRRVVAFEPYHQVGFCEVFVSRVRRALGEIGDAEVSSAIAPPPSRLPGEEPAAVARRHLSLGRKLLASRAFAQAHENAQRAIALAPSAEAWRLEGDVFAAEGRCADALRAFDAALGLDPRDEAAAAARQACAR